MLEHSLNSNFLRAGSRFRVEPPITIVGDVHGQLYDMLEIMSFIGHPPLKQMLLLGDYVDRGDYSLETITLLLAFKLRFPQEIYLLRGNHETRCVNRQYGFYDECKRKFPRNGVELWTTFQHVFNCLPVAALVGSRIFCAHGGISEDLISFRQFERVYRPTDICDIGLLCDLIWSDPSTTNDLYEPSPRGVSAVFGKTAVNKFCSSLKIDMICRAHQCVADGYEFFADRKCLTLFSAPCYCGELDNQAAVLLVGSRLECRVLTFKKEIKPVGTSRGTACEEGYAALSRTPQSQNRTGDEGSKATQTPAETPLLRTAEDTGSQEKSKESSKLLDRNSVEKAKSPRNARQESKEQRNEKK
ncbi:putative phosphoprotein phosphatase 1 [Ancylostoma caninum]|uniref:Serine/threonine-protein phosphatase n=1 Tax=Ancylostoma caninum TaxID=29170 RepID=A0A368FEC5_ANCCA|nr:putative phosphoprotein phosphatase 1 [Ancylostoma caninum]